MLLPTSLLIIGSGIMPRCGGRSKAAIAKGMAERASGSSLPPWSGKYCELFTGFFPGDRGAIRSDLSVTEAGRQEIRKYLRNDLQRVGQAHLGIRRTPETQHSTHGAGTFKFLVDAGRHDAIVISGRYLFRNLHGKGPDHRRPPECWRSNGAHSDSSSGSSTGPEEEPQIKSNYSDGNMSLSRETGAFYCGRPGVGADKPRRNPQRSRMRQYYHP
jgi:hypothetical protein